jgi:uncharacterized membrane protein YfcA
MNDRVSYVVIGLLVVLVCILIVTYASQEAASDIFGVLPLLGATLVTFGFPIKWYWKQVRKTRFWLTLSVLLLMHLGGYLYALNGIGRLPGLLYALITPLEWGVMLPILDYTLGIDRKFRAHTR